MPGGMSLVSTLVVAIPPSVPLALLAPVLLLVVHMAVPLATVYVDIASAVPCGLPPIHLWSSPWSLRLSLLVARMPHTPRPRCHVAYGAGAVGFRTMNMASPGVSGRSPLPPLTAACVA